MSIYERNAGIFDDLSGYLFYSIDIVVLARLAQGQTRHQNRLTLAAIIVLVVEWEYVVPFELGLSFRAALRKTVVFNLNAEALNAEFPCHNAGISTSLVSGHQIPSRIMSS